MRLHAVFFYVLSALAIEVKSHIFTKSGGGPGKKSDELGSYGGAPHKRSANFHRFYKRSPYGLVYNQGKPIGILEPISQSYEYSAYAPKEGAAHYKSQWFPVKREADLDLDLEEKGVDSSALHSNNYASVLAKFKQVKRELRANNKLDDVKKRGAFDIGDLSAPQIKTAKVKRADEDDIADLEEGLKEVMGDMGLVEKKGKREIYFEDEDLENGLNKIGLAKESHYDARDKKENCPGKTKGAKSKASRRTRKKLKKKPEEEPDEENSDEDDSKRSVGQKHVERKSTGGDAKTNVIANYQNEGEAFIRSKRQEKEGDDSNVMKDLEQSGELTVSGNKSPLVAVTSAGDDLDAKKRDKEELEYEKRLERNIQAKIDAIKDEVKREIGKVKKDGDAAQRKKREIANTLLDGETSLLDPRLNNDQKLETYVRKRRDLLEQAQQKAEEEAETNKDRAVDTKDLLEQVREEEDTNKDRDERALKTDDLLEQKEEETNKDREERSAAAITKTKESRDAINEIESPAKRNAHVEPVAKNITKRSETEKADGASVETVKQHKRSDAEVDLSTGKTVVDLGEENNERQERNAYSSENKRLSNVTETSDDDMAKRNLDELEEDGALKSNKYANVDVDSRLERNTNTKILDDDSNIYRQGGRRRRALYNKKQRYARRRKRNDFSEEEDPELVGYRAEGDGEIDDEGDEMDDDGFNDQTSNYLNKRQAASDYEEASDADYEDEIGDDYLDRNKRNSDESELETAYDNFLFYPHVRRKRLVEAHGGDATLKHLNAVRERNMRPIEKTYRRKRLEQLNKLHSQKQNIAELSDSDIFGGLPQSYEGELSRFKRVKREN